MAAYRLRLYYIIQNLCFRLKGNTRRQSFLPPLAISLYRTAVSSHKVSDFLPACLVKSSCRALPVAHVPPENNDCT